MPFLSTMFLRKKKGRTTYKAAATRSTKVKFASKFCIELWLVWGRYMMNDEGEDVRWRECARERLIGRSWSKKKKEHKEVNVEVKKGRSGPTVSRDSQAGFYMSKHPRDLTGLALRKVTTQMSIPDM